mmetsp:Transcript_22988/g.58311  ORF Transcript_22988/g.58311 Transcript_22988/m.58311 type:complete len:139 (+) Transcript_22988:1677-2093(+)
MPEKRRRKKKEKKGGKKEKRQKKRKAEQHKKENAKKVAKSSTAQQSAKKPASAKKSSSSSQMETMLKNIRKLARACNIGIGSKLESDEDKLKEIYKRFEGKGVKLVPSRVATLSKKYVSSVQQQVDIFNDRKALKLSN